MNRLILQTKPLLACLLAAALLVACDSRGPDEPQQPMSPQSAASQPAEPPPAASTALSNGTAGDAPAGGVASDRGAATPDPAAGAAAVPPAPVPAPQDEKPVAATLQSCVQMCEDGSSVEITCSADQVAVCDCDGEPRTKCEAR